jgi:hypothetical protein
MNEDVDTMEATAPISAVTNKLIITEHEENNLNIKHHDTIDTVPSGASAATSLSSVTEIQQAGPENEDPIETSGSGRRKRAPRRIGDLNSCLCGMAVNLSVDSNRAIECQQPGCETQWVCFYTHKLCHEIDSHFLQYHLECIALEQAPTKWICEACEASGPARTKRPRK